jgi:hypothetical protein
MSALRAAFADFKLVRTRGVAQLVMEVPIEEADAALALLGGVPKAAAEKWVGIAPLLESDGDRETSPEKPEPPARPGGRPAPSDDPLGQISLAAHAKKMVESEKRAGERIRTRAVMLCKDRKFQEWICGADAEEDMEAEASEALRRELGIDSRSELALHIPAQKRFLDLEARFRAETGQMAERR